MFLIVISGLVLKKEKICKLLKDFREYGKIVGNR
jgi:hypothetical protein